MIPTSAGVLNPVFTFDPAVDDDELLLATLSAPELEPPAE